MSTYGKRPEAAGSFSPEWDEYLHYMYLPIKMADDVVVRIPERLNMLRPMVSEAIRQESARDNDIFGQYIYITARRGFATPGNPLNRPGWHADGFGTTDVNYVWTDRFPTRFAVGEMANVSDDHIESLRQFELWAEGHEYNGTWSEPMNAALNVLYRLDPFVVHATPEIAPPGGERSFVKISFSPNKYNLKGNSHNYLFDYKWRMWSRDEIRNDPAYAGGDSAPDA